MDIAVTSTMKIPKAINMRLVCGGDFSATLDRTQWGMDYIVGPIPAEVQLSIQVEGIKQ